MSCRLVTTILTSVLISLTAYSGAQEAGIQKQEIAATEPARRGDLGRWTEHYDERIVQFREENAQLVPGQKHIVFVGDSLTEGFPLHRYFPGLPVLNRGITSDGTTKYPIGPINRGVISRLDESILDTHPEVVFLLIGTNDLPAQDIPLWYWIGAYEEIIDRTLDEHPDVQFVLHTLPPTGEAYSRHSMLNPRIRAYNERIREVAERRELPLIDLYELYADDSGMLPADVTRDGLHISKDAYKLWADDARQYFPDSNDPEEGKANP